MELEQLGITNEDLIERIVDRAALLLIDTLEKSLSTLDEAISLRVKNSMNEKIQESIRGAIERIGDELIAPRVDEIVRSTTFRRSNEWGEPKSEPMTFLEYGLKCMESYCSEDVDFDGRPQRKCASGWRRYSTRVAFLVEKTLESNINAALIEMMRDANNQIVGGIRASIEECLKGLSSRIRVGATTISR